MRLTFDERLPHRFVLVCGALFGLSVVFLTPPFSAPDELAHLLRAYHCSQGKLYAVKLEGHTGDFIPSSFGEVYGAVTHFASKESQFAVNWCRIDAAADIPLDPQRQEFLAFANTALYTPVPYLPQAVVMWFGRRYEMRPLYLIYAGRLANLAAYLFLAAAAVRIAPVQKWTLVLVALMPMTVYLASVLSADGVTIGLAMLIFALTMDLATCDGLARISRLALLGLLLVLLGLAKQAYLGLVLLPLAIPADRFASPGRHWLAMGLLVGMPTAIDVAWSYSLREIYIPLLPFVDPPRQVHWILTHPGAYVSVMFKTMYDRDLYSHMIGFFGWLGPHLWKTTRDTYWVAMSTTAVLDGGRRLPLDLRKRLIVFGVYVAAAALMETLIYVSWEPIGLKGIIEGIQPRYLLPIIPLLFLPIRGWQDLAGSRFSRIVVPIVAAIAVTVGVAGTWWILYKRYYW